MTCQRTITLAAAVLATAAATAQQPFTQQPYGQPAVKPQDNGPAQETAQERLRKNEVYQSQRWNAAFHLEEVLQLPQIPNFSFAGARVVRINPGSPLQQLNLKPGDIITRLDGTKIDTGKWANQEGCFWMMPQFERHFGNTTVRFVRYGTNEVLEASVDLGPRCRPARFPDLPGPSLLP